MHNEAISLIIAAADRAAHDVARFKDQLATAQEKLDRLPEDEFLSILVTRNQDSLNRAEARYKSLNHSADTLRAQVPAHQ